MSASTPSLTLSDYLEKLPLATFKRLYLQPSTAFAIFRRMLPHLAKTFVMAMLYMPTPLLYSDLDTWVKPDAKLAQNQALGILKRMYIVNLTAPGRDKPQEITLTPNFKKSLQLALEGGGTENSFGVPSSLDVPRGIDIAFLDRYARKKWEDILHYVVNSVGMTVSGSSSSGPASSVKDLLFKGQLIERGAGGSGAGVITQSGFTFLLQESNAQVWTLLLQWLDDSVEPEGSKHAPISVDRLGFLFMLASLELGRAYSTKALTEERRNMLQDLRDFGLIYMEKADPETGERPEQYFPTRLATTLTSSASALRSVSSGFDAATTTTGGSGALVPTSGSTNPSSSDNGQQKGSIILETNYRIYAYTSSPLQIAVLALFCSLKLRFSGMVSGRLTRDSIRRAIRYGITADQIISYLATHAHEQMHRTAALQNKPVLPPTVVDQIRLWQLENERMHTTPGFFLNEFEDKRQYDLMVKYADEIGVLVWRSDVKKVFFATKIEQLMAYLRVIRKTDK